MKSKSSKNNRGSKENKELRKLVKNILEFKLRDKNNTSSMLLKEKLDLNSLERSKKKQDLLLKPNLLLKKQREKDLLKSIV